MNFIFKAQCINFTQRGLSLAFLVYPRNAIDIFLALPPHTIRCVWHIDRQLTLIDGIGIGLPLYVYIFVGLSFPKTFQLVNLIGLLSRIIFTTKCVQNAATNSFVYFPEMEFDSSSMQLQLGSPKYTNRNLCEIYCA